MHEDDVFYGCLSLKSITLPPATTIIGSMMFACSGLTELELPDGVREIRSSAFYDCENLERITIPAGIECIEGGAFQDCTALSTITFEGDAPLDIHNRIFENVTATVYYPAGNDSWTPDVMQQYGGNITWVAYSAGQVVPGDINGDHAVNNKDATRLFQYLSDWDVAVVEEALDVNGDGEVNNKDATRLFQYLSDWDVEIF